MPCDYSPGPVFEVESTAFPERQKIGGNDSDQGDFATQAISRESFGCHSLGWGALLAS